MHTNNKYNYHSEDDIDGISQWRSLNEAIPSNRTEMVYNINEVSGNAAIRYYWIDNKTDIKISLIDS